MLSLMSHSEFLILFCLQSVAYKKKRVCILYRIAWQMNGNNAAEKTTSFPTNGFSNIVHVQREEKRQLFE